jgi:hypothetical protein
MGNDTEIVLLHTIMRGLFPFISNQSINQNAQPAMLAGQLTLTHYHVTPEPSRE